MLEISIEDLKELVEYAGSMCDECRGPQTACDICPINKWEKKLKELEGGQQ